MNMKAKTTALLLIIVLAACKSKDQRETLQVEVAPQDSVQLIEPEPVPSPEPLEKMIDEGVNQDDNYFLIISSYTVEEFAEEWKEVYRKKGFRSDLVMKGDDGYYRLALKSFNDLKLAEDALKEMQQEKEFGEMWILAK